MTLECLRDNMRILAEASNAARNLVYGINGMPYKYFLMTQEIALSVGRYIKMMEKAVIEEYNNHKD